MVADRKSILDMAMGSIAEITDNEVNRVICNVMDPNTKATAKRKITLTLEFAPDEYRERIDMSISAKTTLCPVNPARTTVCVTRARDGSLMLAEMVAQAPGQIDMDGGEAPVPAMANIGKAKF